MAWFGQGKDTIEWEEYRPDVLFYKWKNKEIKRGSRLIIRSGQKAIFYANGRVEGIFEQEGDYDIFSDIVPFLSTLKGIVSLKSDTGLRSEVYFVNAKELLLPWGTRQRIMIPTPEVPSGIPVGANGNMVIEFRDYLTFIQKVAGVKATYTLSDISERVLGEINGILPEVILEGSQMISMQALVQLQRNQRKYGKVIAEELDKELFDIGLGVRDVNINSFSYPPEVQKMAEKVAAQSFVQDTGKYTTIAAADSFSNGGGGGIGAAAAQAGIGVEIGRQIANSLNNQNQPQPQPMYAAPGPATAPGQVYTCRKCGNVVALPAKFCANCGTPVEMAAPTASAGERFCPNCRKMVNGNFCPECGTQTV